MPGPLAGIRVVDLSVMVSGPLATMLLADQGADVVKVETPGIGDLVRYLGTSHGGLSGMFLNCNRGKRSVTLDLKNDQGRAALLELVKSADVFVQNFRPGAAERLGIGAADLHAINPNLVYCSISGFGADGPYSHRRVYDNVIQAYSGFAAVQTNPATGEPAVLRNLVCDKITAYTAAQAITSALFARERHPERHGQHIELAMLDAGIAFLWPDGGMDEVVRSPEANRAPTLGAYYSVTRMADGFTTGTVVSDAEFQGWCRAINRPELAEDPRFATLADRVRNAQSLVPEMMEAALGMHVDAFIAAAEAHDVPAAPVLTLPQVAADPQVRHNGVFVEREHPAAGPLREARPAPRFSTTPVAAADHAPLLGEHTDAVLTELGFDAAALRAAGACG
jgi:crotonobetainyl-CoA:carnitine CoA-transferase CaiB-like acyl-CoA transferase